MGKLYIRRDFEREAPIICRNGTFVHKTNSAAERPARPPLQTLHDFIRKIDPVFNGYGVFGREQQIALVYMTKRMLHLVLVSPSFKAEITRAVDAYFNSQKRTTRFVTSLGDIVVRTDSVLGTVITLEFQTERRFRRLLARVTTTV